MLLSLRLELARDERDTFLRLALLVASVCLLVDRIDSEIKALVINHTLGGERILTEGVQFVEAYGTLALRLLDAASVENVVALK